MLSSTVEIHNSKKEDLEKIDNDRNITNIRNFEPKEKSFSRLPCTTFQLLLIIIPTAVIAIFAIIFIPVYVVSKDCDNNSNDDDKKITLNIQNDMPNSEQNNIINQFDDFDEYVANVTYATLTPKDGYDNILIFLGGITESSNKYFDFFKSKKTFVPKGTKIYCLAGEVREMKFMTDWGSPDNHAQGWFNVGADANLEPPGDYTEAKEALKLVSDYIIRIKTDENVKYRNIYLSGFSQGAAMTNYVFLNFPHELGGYLAFSGYVFDHLFPANTLAEKPYTTEQQAKLDSRFDYHILATHSFHDGTVPYAISSSSYYTYYENYVDFTLLSFGHLGHIFPDQPIHPFVKKWLIESMGK